MTQEQRLNLKFTVADVDQIKQLCASRMTDLQIVVWMRLNRSCEITLEDVRRICEEAGQIVRVDRRPA
jgi:hypothetical protein